MSNLAKLIQKMNAVKVEKYSESAISIPTDENAVLELFNDHSAGKNKTATNVGHDARDMDLLCKVYGLNGHESVTTHDLSCVYGITKQRITSIVDLMVKRAVVRYVDRSINAIRHIVSRWTSPEMESYCSDNNIVILNCIDKADHLKPTDVLVLLFDDEISHRTTADYIQQGYKIGTYLHEVREIFEAPGRQGLDEKVIVGFIDLRTNEVHEWVVEDPYNAHQAAWLAEHAGRVCSCGHVMNELRDFSHGCGDNTCYMCS